MPLKINFMGSFAKDFLCASLLEQERHLVLFPLTREVLITSFSLPHRVQRHNHTAWLRVFLPTNFKTFQYPKFLLVKSMNLLVSIHLHATIIAWYRIKYKCY